MLARNFLKRQLRPLLSFPKYYYSTEAAEIPKPSDFKSGKYFEMNDKTGIIITLKDQKGVLNKALNVLDNNGVNLTRIESKPSKYHKEDSAFDFYIDFYGTLEDESVRNAISELSKISKHLTICGTPNVPWFPTSILDLDKIGKETLGEGDGIEMTDHPGFNDTVYKERRNQITQVAMKYMMNDSEIPRVEYTPQELDVWSHVYPKLKKLYVGGACAEYNDALDKFEKNCGYAIDNIPQLEDISAYLKSKTGWRLRPVGGLLSQREFLNGLAFKVFHSTQYIRHHSNPEYTPEPDIVHELMGHAPMFANKDFSDYSQMIGLASLGCPDMYLPRLATIYWYTVEFGMCLEEGQKKAYGAGVLSSFGEFEWALSDQPKFYPLDCEEVAENHRDFPISSVQPYYFLANSFADSKKKILEYTETIPRPFNVSYNESKQTIEVDRRIKGVC
jgi:phenylalanine-4-hydroxylase